MDLYADGKGIPADMAKAYPVFQEAAETGNPVAQYYMGHASQYAHVTGLDYKKAWFMYRKAAEAGIGRAYGRMGFMYEKGLGREKDIEKAAAYYKKAPDSDFVAKTLLAQMVIEGGIRGSKQSSVFDLEAAVRLDHPQAMHLLGFYHCFEKIDDAKPRYGKLLMEQGMELGYPPCAYHLARLACGDTPHFPDDDKLWGRLIKRFDQLFKKKAAVMVEEALYDYQTSGIEAGIQKMDDKASVWMKTAWDASWDTFSGAVWTEAQVRSGREDPEWSRTLYQWIYDYGKARSNLSSNYYFRPTLMGNLSKELVETGRIAELSELASLTREGYLQDRKIDTVMTPRSELNYGVPKMPNLDSFEMPLRYQQGADVADKYIGKLLYNSNIYGLNILVRSEFLSGNWRDAMIYPEWIRRWVEEVERDGINQVSRKNEVWQLQGNVSEELGPIWTILGFYERALALYEVPIQSNKKGYGYRHIHIVKTQRALVQTETGSDLNYNLEALTELRAQRAANKYDTKRAPYEVDLAIAATLRREGKVDAAYDLLAKTIEVTTEARLIVAQIEALRMRALWALQDGHLEHCEDDLVTALNLCRSKGLKIKEPELYHLYARYKAAIGDYDAAIEFQLQAVDLYKALDLYTWLPLRYIELSEWYRTIGNDALADYYLELARSLLNQPGAEYPQWIIDDVRNRIATQDEIKLRNELVEVQPVHPAPATKTGSLNKRTEQSTVDLQPTLLVAIPLESKPALGLYTLTNFSDSTKQVTLAARGLVNSFSQNELGDYVVRIGGAADSTETQVEVQLTAEEQLIIYVQALADSAPISLELALVEDGHEDQVVSFSYPESESVAEEAVINASYVENNPFYMVSIFHVLQRLDSKEAASQDLRFIASEPARIEAYDALGHLMFVDADGDGEFHSPGDVLSADHNQNAVADVIYATGEDATSLELKVLPHQRPESGQLEIEIRSFSDDAWQSDAVDVIRYSD
jgi:hypothetical protein